MMDADIAVNYRNPAALRKAGINALKKELGSVGAIYFLRQFELGCGNYTAEREQLLSGVTHEDIVKSIRGLDAEKK